MGKIYDSFYRLGQEKVSEVAAVRGSAGMNMLLAADLCVVALARVAVHASQAECTPVGTS